MKNFILGMSIAVILGFIGLSAIVTSLPSKSSVSLSRNCTFGQVKDCYSGHPSPNNPCCPIKYRAETI